MSAVTSLIAGAQANIGNVASNGVATISPGSMSTNVYTIVRRCVNALRRNAPAMSIRLPGRPQCSRLFRSVPLQGATYVATRRWFGV